MTYNMTVRVYDNTNKQVHENILSKDLTNPTVKDVKALLNPGTYTNIKSEKFICDSKDGLVDTHVIVTPFILWTINLA
jgi:hypothetical protein